MAHLSQKAHLLIPGAGDSRSQLLKREAMIVDGLKIGRVTLRHLGIALRCKRQLTRAVVCRLDRDGDQLRLGRAAR